MHTLKGIMTLRDYKSQFLCTHLYLQALIQDPSVRIWWNPGPFDNILAPFLLESAGHQKVQIFCS